MSTNKITAAQRLNLSRPEKRATTMLHNYLVNPGDAPGKILHLGRFGGAYVQCYRIVRKLDEHHADLTPVRAESCRNDDGTFSTVWVDE
jgi:hypothetical protein